MQVRRAIPTIMAVLCALPLSAATPVDLVPGAPIEAELTGGESHVYQVTLAADQYLHVIAEQRGIDLQVAVIGPDGRQVVSIDIVGAMTGFEPVSVLADIPGPYRLEISAVNKNAVKGEYRVRIDELRAAQPQDRTRIEAQKLFVEGHRLASLGNAESYQAALQKFERAMELWQTLGDRWYQAVTWNEMGMAHWLTGQPQPALKEQSAALSLFRDLGDKRGEGEALNDLGTVYAWLDDLRQALECFNQALAIVRAAGERLGEETVLINIGLMQSELGQREEALKSYSAALTLERAIGDRDGEAAALHNLGRLYDQLGRNQEALETLGKGLEIYQAVGNQRSSALTLALMGGVYARLGDFQKAMDKYTQALPLSHQAGDKSGEAYTLSAIGEVYRMMGEPRRALQYLNQALPIGVASQRPQVEATIRARIGAAYAGMNEKRKALGYYSEALQLEQKAGRVEGEVLALARSGPLYADVGEAAKAVESIDRALELTRQSQYKPGEAIALLARARIERDRNRLNEALADLEAALEIVESTRTDLASEELRIAYFASNRQYYELYIDVLMKLHQAGAALEASERARARSLLESLTEAHADIRQGVDRVLLEREQTLQQEINAAERRQTQLLSRKDRVEQTKSVEKELNTLLSDYQDVQARIRTTSPRYAALTQPRPLPLTQIQQQVLDGHSLLLEYSLGDDHSYLFAVTPASVKGFVLPRRTEIETAVKQAYDLLKSSARRQFQEQSELALARLSRMLLGPVAAQLANKRLLIAADGALQYIPFQALPLPGPSGSGARDPLVAKHEIVELPSASVLAVLRQEVAGREPAPKMVAILSDPVFQKDDPRVARTQDAKTMRDPAIGREDLRHAQFVRSAAESGVGRFQRLPFSRKEADSIERLAPAGQALKAVDFAANKATATSAEINRYRMVHFATHGLINSQHPELSGIVLSLVDERGQPRDGFLRTHEVYNLRLSADLVVLSACQTALGKEINGEGLLSLTRGFMYAGAPRVVASLWDVRDEATAELMKRFYASMIKDGLTPAAALRAAQLSMRKEKGWESPYYWAAFVLQGEWRPAIAAK